MTGFKKLCDAYRCILFAARMTRDKIGDQILLFAGTVTRFFESLLEFGVTGHSRLLHQAQGFFIDVFRGDL